MVALRAVVGAVWGCCRLVGGVVVSGAAVLPAGWTSFRSQDGETWSGARVSGHWYATAPYAGAALDAVRERLGQYAKSLECTVSAESWDELCAAAAAQHEVWESLTADDSA